MFFFTLLRLAALIVRLSDVANSTAIRALVVVRPWIWNVTSIAFARHGELVSGLCRKLRDPPTDAPILAK